MTPVQHFVVLDGQQQGPFTLTQLRGMWTNGQINMQTQHFMDGYTEWMPLGFIREDLEEPAVPASVQPAPPAFRAPAPADGKKKKPKSNVGVLIGVGALVIFGALVLMAISSGGAGRRNRVPDYEVRMNTEKVKAEMAEKGIAVTSPRDRAVELILPLQASMQATERQAKELALEAQSRLGDGVIVRVKSPAGQTLAEVGP
jgi:hypothetical protein